MLSPVQPEAGECLPLHSHDSRARLHAGRQAAVLEKRRTALRGAPFAKHLPAQEQQGQPSPLQQGQLQLSFILPPVLGM